jgi:hypothetical protein
LFIDDIDGSLAADPAPRTPLGTGRKPTARGLAAETTDRNLPSMHGCPECVRFGWLGGGSSQDRSDVIKSRT